MSETAIEAKFEAHKEDHERRWSEHGEKHEDIERATTARHRRINDRLSEHDTLIGEIRDTSQFIRGAVRMLVWMVGFLVGGLGIAGTIVGIWAATK